MTLNQALAERIRQRLAQREGVREKRILGIGFLLNGNLCLGVWKGSLIVRLVRSKLKPLCWSRTSASSRSGDGR